MKNTLGIVRNKWSANEKGYYFSALGFYDEVIYIDPKEVTYTYERDGSIPIISYNGFVLNNLSMLYTFGYQRAMLLLVQSLMLCGCPISDTYETLSRNGIGKVGERITAFKNNCGTTSYIFGSYSSGKRFFKTFSKEKFPLVSKPIFGNKGKGIEKLEDKQDALKYLQSYFSHTNDFIVLESFMNYVKEWRVYLIDGEIIFSYEKSKPEGSFLANLHQSAKSVPTSSNDKDMINHFVLHNISDVYQTGIYGVDVALTDKGTLHIIEINRTPGWKGVHDISSDIIFPIEVHRRLRKRARISLLPEDEKEITIVITGDTSFGENYQVRLAEKGKENILSSKGYDYSIENFDPILKQSDLVIVNLETPITDLNKSTLERKKEYLHWSDIKKTPETLNKHNIKVVSLANNHAIDYGQEGLKQTLDILREYDVKCFGAGLNKKEAMREVKYDVKLGKAHRRFVITAGSDYRSYYDKVFRYYAKSKRGGANSWSLKKAGGEIQDIRQNNIDAFIVAYPHWGGNYLEMTEKQQKLAHILIDSGADLVLGHGSHMLQGIEEYKGRWIVYSLGNFVFNSPGRFKKTNVDPLSIIARLHFSERNGNVNISLRLYPIFTDNRVTNYKSNFATYDQFIYSLNLLIKNSSPESHLVNKLRLGKDEIGNYFVIDLTSEAAHISPS